MNKSIQSDILGKPAEDQEQQDRYRAPALDKGLDILELLADQPEGLTRGEIVKALDRGPSEIYRMLERLVARQYVLRSLAGDRYSLSLKMFDLAHRYPPNHRLVTQALPVMDRYVKEAEQSCHLGVYDRGNVQIVAQVSSPATCGMTVRPGTRVNLLDTGSVPVISRVRVRDGTLPFRIVQIVGGPNGHVVLEEGSRLFVGDEVEGLRLVLIDNGKVVFDGAQRYEVRW